jgi:hypothetical protein
MKLEKFIFRETDIPFFGDREKGDIFTVQKT